MLTYFLSTMDVRTKWVEPRLTGDPIKTALLYEVRDGIRSFNERFSVAGPHVMDGAWNEANRLERILALIEPPENLQAELKRRISEAADEMLPAAPRLAASLEAALPLAFDTSVMPPTLRTGGEQLLRALLVETLEELHWASQRKFYSRPIQKQATRRIVGSGLLAFLALILPYLALHGYQYCGSALPLERWSGLTLYTALTGGLFGAFFSRLLFLQTNWNMLTLGAIKDARDLSSVVLRGCVGMTGAVVVFFFLHSGVVTGALLPKFSEMGLTQKNYPDPAPAGKNDGTVPLRLIYPNEALALLVVWSFLAGFSERMVPSILQSTEGSLGKNPGVT